MFGIPPPDEFEWRRNGEKVTSSKEGAGVYQTLGSTYSILYVEDAKLSDDGNFICYASNKVSNETGRRNATKEIRLAGKSIRMQ